MKHVKFASRFVQLVLFLFITYTCYFFSHIGQNTALIVGTNNKRTSRRYLQRSAMGRSNSSNPSFNSSLSNTSIPVASLAPPKKHAPRYNQKIIYLRRQTPQMPNHWFDTLWTIELKIDEALRDLENKNDIPPEDIGNRSFQSLVVFALAMPPMNTLITAEIEDERYTLRPLPGFEDCIEKRFNFFVQYSVTFNKTLSNLNEIILRRKHPMYLLEVWGITPTGEGVMLKKNVEFKPWVPHPRKCITPRYPRLSTRKDVFKSLSACVDQDKLQTINITFPPHKDCAIVTAALGTYESCLHPVFTSSSSDESPSHSVRHRCVALAFTDQDNTTLTIHPDWTVIRIPYFMADIRLHDASDMKRGKYYKMQVYKLLPKQFRYMMWLDATMEVLNTSTVASWLAQLEQGSTHLITAPHTTRQYLLGEACGSFNKYMDQYYNVISDYMEAVQDGFCEKYWLSNQSQLDVRDLTIVTAGAYCGDSSTYNL
eukprot:PhF_6_TR24840/c0_g1_i2/m.34258